MKALTLTQPWATLVAIRAKRIETRSWSTSVRGLFAIHAAKGFPDDCMDLCSEEPFRSVLAAYGIHGPVDLPRGQIVCVAKLIACGPVESVPEVFLSLPHEREFGNFASGRCAWILDEARKLREPIACKGAQGLWTVPQPIELAVYDQLRGTL